MYRRSLIDRSPGPWHPTPRQYADALRGGLGLGVPLRIVTVTGVDGTPVTRPSRTDDRWRGWATALLDVAPEKVHQRATARRQSPLQMTSPTGSAAGAALIAEFDSWTSTYPDRYQRFIPPGQDFGSAKALLSVGADAEPEQLGWLLKLLAQLVADVTGRPVFVGRYPTGTTRAEPLTAVADAQPIRLLEMFDPRWHVVLLQEGDPPDLPDSFRHLVDLSGLLSPRIQQPRLGLLGGSPIGVSDRLRQEMVDRLGGDVPVSAVDRMVRQLGESSPTPAVDDLANWLPGQVAGQGIRDDELADLVELAGQVPPDMPLDRDAIEYVVRDRLHIHRSEPVDRYDFHTVAELVRGARAAGLGTDAAGLEAHAIATVGRIGGGHTLDAYRHWPALTTQAATPALFGAVLALVHAAEEGISPARLREQVLAGLRAGLDHAGMSDDALLDELLAAMIEYSDRVERGEPPQLPPRAGNAGAGGLGVGDMWVIVRWYRAAMGLPSAVLAMIEAGSIAVSPEHSAAVDRLLRELTASQPNPGIHDLLAWVATLAPGQPRGLPASEADVRDLVEIVTQIPAGVEIRRHRIAAVIRDRLRVDDAAEIDNYDLRTVADLLRQAREAGMATDAGGLATVSNDRLGPLPSGRSALAGYRYLRALSSREPTVPVLEVVLELARVSGVAAVPSPSAVRERLLAQAGGRPEFAGMTDTELLDGAIDAVMTFVPPGEQDQSDWSPTDLSDVLGMMTAVRAQATATDEPTASTSRPAPVGATEEDLFDYPSDDDEQQPDIPLPVLDDNTVELFKKLRLGDPNTTKPMVRSLVLSLPDTAHETLSNHTRGSSPRHSAAAGRRADLRCHPEPTGAGSAT